jgi:DNA-binding transcriptional LysR family regulator
VNLRHLRYLVVLAEERHFHRAAERLHISQSTLSSALHQLEEELGVPLVRRDRRRFDALTEPGVVALAEARRVLGACATMEAALASLGAEVTGNVTLGVIPTAEPTLPAFTIALAAAAPRIAVRERLMNTRDIVQSVLDRSIHAGIAYVDFDLDPRIQVQPLYDEHYVVCGPAKRLPRALRPVPWSDAAQLPLAMLTPDMRNRQILDRHFDTLGLRPVPRIELNSVLAVLAHVHATDCCAIVPAAATRFVRHVPRLAVRPMGEPALAVPVGLLLRREAPLPPLSRSLLAAASKAGLESTEGMQGFID